MTKFQIEFKKSAEKEFHKLTASVQERIRDSLVLLSHNPRTQILDIKKLKGFEALYRMRVGDYRVLYELNNNKLVIIVVKLGHRRDVYLH